MAGVRLIQPQELTSEVVSVLVAQLEGDLDGGERSQPVVSFSVSGSRGTQVFGSAFDTARRPRMGSSVLAHSSNEDTAWRGVSGGSRWPSSEAAK